MAGYRKQLGKLKTTPSDFRVSEATVLPLCFDNSKNMLPFYYAKLTKTGYTTFEAIVILASKLKIHLSSIGYAGLKDEDGITEQYISLPSSEITPNKISACNVHDRKKFIQLDYIGVGKQSLAIGQLCGNNFRIVVRNLDKLLAEKIHQKKHYSNLFINYYGTQRFGLAKQTKATHLLGEMLLQKKYEKALAILREQDNLEGLKSREYRGNASVFFNSLDIRTLCFYQNAYYSYQWNEDMKKNIINQTDNWREHREDGIIYFFITSTKDKLKLLHSKPEIFYPKIRPEQELLIKRIAKRTTIIQYDMTCNSIFKDEYNANKWCCELTFFLPSGCYATMALQQFILDKILESVSALDKI